MINDGLQKYGWSEAAPKVSHDYIFPKVLELMPANMPLRILDAGCGNGYMANELAKLGHEVVGIDIAEDGISIAKKQYPNVKFYARSLYENITDIIADVDLIVSTEVIEHLYSPKTYLQNLHTVLRPSGSIILTTPYHGYLKNLALSITNSWDKHHTVDWEGGHIKFFSEKTLSKMIHEADFVNIQFNNAGRINWLWKSMVCRAEKNA